MESLLSVSNPCVLHWREDCFRLPGFFLWDLCHSYCISGNDSPRLGLVDSKYCIPIRNTATSPWSDRRIHRKNVYGTQAATCLPHRKNQYSEVRGQSDN